MAYLTSKSTFKISLNLSLSLCFFLLGVIASGTVFAEEFDFEKEFGLQQKTTLDTFPLKEIDTDSLSDMAIEGALQVQNTTGADGKPVHVKLKEESDKEKSGEAIDEAEKDPTKDDDLLKFSQSLPAEPQFQPIIYSQPTGRTYTEHHTTTTFRP